MGSLYTCMYWWLTWTQKRYLEREAESFHDFSHTTITRHAVTRGVHVVSVSSLTISVLFRASVLSLHFCFVLVLCPFVPCNWNEMLTFFDPYCNLSVELKKKPSQCSWIVELIPVGVKSTMSSATVAGEVLTSVSCLQCVRVTAKTQMPTTSSVAIVAGPGAPRVMIKAPQVLPLVRTYCLLPTLLTPVWIEQHQWLLRHQSVSQQVQTCL